MSTFAVVLFSALSFAGPCDQVEDEPAEAAFALPTDGPWAPSERHPGRSRVRDRGVRTLTTGAVTTALAVPAGVAVAYALVPTCTPGMRHCLGPMIGGGATGFLLGVAGLGTMAVGTGMIVADEVHQHRVQVHVGPGAVSLTGRF